MLPRISVHLKIESFFFDNYYVYFHIADVDLQNTNPQKNMADKNILSNL